MCFKYYLFIFFLLTNIVSCFSSLFIINMSVFACVSGVTPNHACPARTDICCVSTEY